MKRLIRLSAVIPALASLLLAASCMRENVQEMPEYITGITVTLEQPDFSILAEETKVDYTVSGANINFTWSSEGDVLGIYPIGGDQVSFPLSASDGASAKFDGGAWSLRSTYSYAAYFPFSMDNYFNSEEALPVSYVGQKQSGDNSLAHLGQYSFMSSVATRPDSKGNVNLDMKQLGTWVQLRATLPMGMEVGKVTLTDKTGKLIVGGTMNLTQNPPYGGTFAPALENPVYAESIDLAVENLTISGENTKFWMMLPPQDLSGHQLELTVVSADNARRVTSTITGSKLVRATPTVLKFGDISDIENPGIGGPGDIIIE